MLVKIQSLIDGISVFDFLDLLDQGGSAGAARGSRMTLLHTILSSMSVSSSLSINRLSTKVALGRPLPLCPWTGFQRITLDSGSSGWRIACPASLRLFCLILRLTLGWSS